RGHFRGLDPGAGAGTWLFRDDSAAPRQVALGTNPLLAPQAIFVQTFALEIAGPVPLPRRLGAVLAQVHTDFLLLGHVRIVPKRNARRGGSPGAAHRTFVGAGDCGWFVIDLIGPIGLIGPVGPMTTC